MTTDDSSQHSRSYARLREVICPYVGGMMCDSALKKVLAERGLTPATLKEADVADVVADVMRPLRVLIDKAQLPELMVELATVIRDLEEGD